MQVLVICTPLCRKEVAVFFRVRLCQVRRWAGPDLAQPLRRRSEGAVVLLQGGPSLSVLVAEDVEREEAECTMRSLSMPAVAWKEPRFMRFSRLLRVQMLARLSLDMASMEAWGPREPWRLGTVGRTWVSLISWRPMTRKVSTKKRTVRRKRPPFLCYQSSMTHTVAQQLVRARSRTRTTSSPFTMVLTASEVRPQIGHLPHSDRRVLWVSPREAFELVVPLSELTQAQGSLLEQVLSGPPGRGAIQV